MNEKLIDAIIQGGALGAALLLVVWIFGRKLDRLAELVHRLPERISDQISRVMRQAKLLILVGCLSVTLSGCVAAGQGAAAGAGAALSDRALPPAPYSPATDPGNWLAYTIAGLVAYAAGSAGKGWLRSRAKPPLPDIEDET